MKNWKAWLRAALIRAVRTFAQTAVGFLTGDAIGILEVNWPALLSVSAVAALASILTSLAGLPEVETHPPEDPQL